MPPASGIITLITDFEFWNGSAGAMKGVILGIDPPARLADISRQMAPGLGRYGAVAAGRRSHG